MLPDLTEWGSGRQTHCKGEAKVVLKIKFFVLAFAISFLGKVSSTFKC